MTIVCGLKALTAGEIRQRAEKWFEWDEIRLRLGAEFVPLELGFNRYEDGDWTSVEDFRLLLNQMGDSELLKFRCQGKNVCVVGVEDAGEPFLVVEGV